jgi:hypothetical protein
MLNLVNRVIVSILLIILIVALVAVAVTPNGVAALLMSLLLQVNVDTFSVVHLIVLIGSLVLALLLGVLLAQEVRRPQRSSIVIHGQVAQEVATDSVIQRIRANVEALSGVRSANVRLSNNGQLVSPFVELKVDPEAHVPSKAAEVDQVAQDTITQLGLKPGKVRVKLHVVTAKKPLIRPPTKPSAPPSAGVTPN